MEHKIAVTIICLSFFAGYVIFYAGLILPSTTLRFIGCGFVIGASVGLCRKMGLIETITWRSE